MTASEDEQDAITPSLGQHKGFSTSISALFHEPMDCCSIVYCGIFQWDYNYFLLKNEQHRSFGSILFFFFVIPIILLFSIAACTILIEDEAQQTITTSTLVFIFLSYMIVVFVMETRKRIKFRRELSDLVGEDQPEHLRTKEGRYQSERDASNAYCCCYGRDDTYHDIHDDTDFEHNFCTRMFQVMNCICCGALCQCWVQVFGACAIAQESREIRRLIDEKRTHTDYLTYEPYSNYYPRLVNLRNTQNKNLFWHVGTLSKLSRSLVQMLFLSSLGFIVLALFELLDDAFLFEFKDMGVFVLTFSQAFLILYFVHWKWNRFDISFDAIVKFFAAGFLLSTFMALFFESAISVLLKIVLNILVLILFPMESPLFNNNTERMLQGYDTDYADDIYYEDDQGFPTKDKEQSEFEKNHPALAVVFSFFHAFVVASLVEELSKYYGFKMVEHPDLMLNYKAESVSNSSPSKNSNNESFLESPLAHNESWVSETLEADRAAGTNSPTTGRSLASIGAGITVAMVTVAMGFACCENLIYIFVYTQGTPGAEMTILIARSVFPVHPLCAAIQSIGVCSRYLEKDTSFSLGHIVFVPILVHGSFDFSLMVLSVLVEQFGENSPIVVFLSFFAPVSVVFLGFFYYFMRSEVQTKRLKSMDSAILADELSAAVIT